MDDAKMHLKGSASRDAFKQAHKAKTNRCFYALDVDLAWVEKSPSGIVAFIDFKKPRDRVTFTEVLCYNALREVAPVYIIEGDDPENGPFVVKQYIGGDWRPEPPTVSLRTERDCRNWSQLATFEDGVRRDYGSRRRGTAK